MISRLKSLELQGYKTFATKTNFEFPGKITAIVGPNGSGKSNIADAIRWVLGEQSYRLLRGRRTEDMIFAGSEGRSRAGMASSTITFNNEDGWLPIDFSEVSVTRRAYRDGQNEYLLNGQRIRLRDIQELLGQSGLAERTYTLIGQGLVDFALSIRPDERRKFFEEAAGIGLYRSRREDSLNRLDQTRHNLERVTDILSELEPRLRSLDRQTRRFLEYKTLQADLQVLLRIWYGYHWNNAQKDLSQSRLVLQEREIHLNNVKNNYEQIEQQFSEIRNQISSKRSMLNELHSQSSNEHLELEKIIRDLAVLEERQRSLNDQEYNQNYDLVRLEEEIKSKESYLENLEAEYQKLTQEVDEAKTNLDEAQKAVNERLKIRGQVENELQRNRRALVENETKSVEAKAKLNELTERINNLKLSLEKLRLEEQEIQKEFKEKEKDLEKSKKDLDDVENSIDNFKKNALVYLTKKQNIDKKLQEKRNILNKLQSEVIKLNAQYDAIIQAEKTLSGFNQGAKNLMNAHRSGKFAGQYQPLSEVLNVPSELETAIAAALGEFLDSIVLLEKSDPSFAIQFLSKGDQGRAILLPLQWLKNDKEQKLPSLNGMVGRASDLIKFDTHYQPVVQSLLGNTIIVDTHDNATKAVRALPSHMRLVTLNGEVFQGNGIVFAGKETRSSIIARPRQKQELKKEIEETQEKFTILEIEIVDLEHELDIINQDHNKITQEEQKGYQELQQSQKLVNQRNLDFEKLSQRKQWIDNQIRSLEQQLANSLESEATTKNLLQETVKIIETLRKESDVLRGKLNEIPIDEFQSNVGHWRTNLAVVERATNEAQKRLLENRTNIDQNQQRFKSILRRLEDLKNALLVIDDERATNKAKEAELKDGIEKIRQQILPTENELKDLEKTFDKLQEEMSNAQQTVTIGERYMT